MKPYYETDLGKLYCGNVFDVLPKLESESVQCCVTSPPYWGLRDYGIEGQLGLEKTHTEYIERMTQVFAMVHGAMRKDGTLWLNIGDSYASGKGKCHNPGVNTSNFNVHTNACNVHPLDRGNKSTLAKEGLKPKDLVGIPWMLAFSLRDFGWWLRQDIIWSKLNPMPESVRDRCTKAHEYLFLMTLNGGNPIYWVHRDKPYCDGVYTKPDPDYRWINKETDEESTEPQEGNEWKKINLWRSFDYYYDQDAIKEPCIEPNSERPRMGQGQNTQYNQKRSNYKQPNSPQSIKSTHGQGFTRRAKGNAKTFRGGGKYTRGQSFDNSHVVERDSHGNEPNQHFVRNKRSSWEIPDELINLFLEWYAQQQPEIKDVWKIATQPFPEAHFATFPVGLVEPCILTGSKVGDIVLDNFAGSGTVAVVCEQLHRRWIGIELSEQYCEIAVRRIEQARKQTVIPQFLSER